ncbi:Gfo/Idh/MocA family oxidoreductase [Pseudalkalibacillus sp. SCS-8]|uniref:Gfo/Idh/MocA family protein n=1 Tax=Pseudalkalibacillus nanhaiensis TaxID=3115291 RepID=UPI0032DB3650
MQKMDGMNYAPEGKRKRVVQEGEFPIAAVCLDHGHIYGMCNGLTEAGASLKLVYDPYPSKVEAFCKAYPGVQVASSLDEVLEDPEIKLVAGAAVPSERCALGLTVLEYGKHYFTDKTPFTKMIQLKAARQKTKETGLIWAVYYSERLHVESAVYAGQLIDQGAIGQVVQVMGTGPHRINVESRPDWFFNKEQYGGILCDIGSHQIEQFLHFAKAEDARVVHSKVGNYKHPNYPELEDFGDATLIADNGATHYFRVDWLTPDGLGTWGDGRTFILGTEGYIELRKYIDIARDKSGDHLYLVNGQGEHHFSLNGEVGFPYFGDLILDCLNGTENAMRQSHTFKAAELCLIAQRDAICLNTEVASIKKD